MGDKHYDRNRFEGATDRSRGPLKGVTVIRVLVVLLLVLNILLIQRLFFSAQGIAGFRKQNEQVEEMKKRILQLKEDNQQLFDRIQSFKRNPRAQEKMIREQLGWARETELIVEFPSHEPPAVERKSP